MTVRSLGACLLLTIAPLALLAGTATAQSVVVPSPSGSQSLPIAETLFDRHIAAIGGMEAIKKHTSLKFTGTIKIPAMKYTAFTTLWQIAPNSLAMFTEPPGAARGETYCDGTYAWDKMPAPDGSTILTLHTDSRWAETLFSADFYADVDYKARYKTTRTTEATEFNGAPAYKVLVESHLGKQLYIFFDQKSGLIVGSHTVQSEGGQLVPLITINGPYTEVDGVKYISGVTHRTPTGDIILSYRVIEPAPKDVPPITLPDELKEQAAALRASPQTPAELPPAEPATPVEDGPN